MIRSPSYMRRFDLRGRDLGEAWTLLVGELSTEVEETSGTLGLDPVLGD